MQHRSTYAAMCMLHGAFAGLLKRSVDDKQKNDKERLDSHYRRNYKVPGIFGFLMQMPLHGRNRSRTAIKVWCAVL